MTPVCFTSAAAPTVDLSALGGREIRVRAGEPLKIDIPITGAPTPTVTWQKDGKDLPPSDRVSPSVYIASSSASLSSSSVPDTIHLGAWCLSGRFDALRP